MTFDPFEARPTIAFNATETTRVASRSRRALSPLWIGAISFALAIVLALVARIYLRKPATTPVAAAPADASVAVAEVDAAQFVPTVQPDAAVVATAEVDTSAPHIAPTDELLPITPERLRPRPRVEPSRTDPQLSDDWRAFATCASTGAAKQAERCVLIACRLREASKALEWFTNVPAAKRANMIASCKIEGVELEHAKLPD